MSERIRGATSVSLEFLLVDVSTGAPKTGLTVTTLKLQYCRALEAPSTATSLTALAAQTTAFTAFGAIEKDATNSPGIYRVDCPNAAFAAGADEVVLTVNASTIKPSSRFVDLNTVSDTVTSLRDLAYTPVANTPGDYWLSAASPPDPWAASLGTYPSGQAGNVVATNLDTNVGSRVATSVYVAPNNSGVTAIKTVTDRLGGMLVIQPSPSVNYQFTSGALGVVAPAGWINTAAFAGGATIPAVAVAQAVADKSGYSLNLSQGGLIPRPLDGVADSSLTVGDALVAAIAGVTGKESVVGTTYTVKTPFTGTVIRTFTLDSSTSPTTRT